MSNVEFVELRVACSGSTYVALIRGIDNRYGLQRLFTNGLFDHCERLQDGTKVEVHRLPICRSIVLEIRETIKGRRIRRYVAIMKGHSVLYQLSLGLTELVAAGKLSLEAAIQRFEAGETADDLPSGGMEVEEV